MYFPLSVQGSEELSVFSDICTSSYYPAPADNLAYGTTGDNVDGYDNIGITDDCDDIWDSGYTANENVGSNYDEIVYASDSSSITVSSVYFDDDGIYTVQLSDMSSFNYAACTVFMELDGTSVYLGEDDEVNIDYSTMILTDNFDGSWLSLDGQPLSLSTVSIGDDVSIYSAPILLNGEETNLRMEYDWGTMSWNVLGTWDGIDDNGIAGRDTQKLKDGDVITPLYYAVSDTDIQYTCGSEYTVSGDIALSYEALPAADYSYSMTLYDIYGCCYYTPTITFTCDSNGEVYFYEDELNGGSYTYGDYYTYDAYNYYDSDDYGYDDYYGYW